MPLRFTIRDLLWLTLVVALGLGWWLEHSHLSLENKTNFNRMVRSQSDVEELTAEINRLNSRLAGKDDIIYKLRNDANR